MAAAHPSRVVLVIALAVAVSCCFSWGAEAARAAGAARGLRPGFYKGKCGYGRDVEKIIYKSMYESFKKDSGIAPGVLRIIFHDCFVRGCDASLLLDGPGKEKESPINRALRGFEALDAAKAALEKACPGVVSCADVVQYAARDTVLLTGGKGWTVSGGRRDGTMSLASEPLQNLPSPLQTPQQMIPLFARKGLNAQQMVVLSGSHTIGLAHCQFITTRIYTFQSPSGVDPQMPPDFVRSLKRQCPSASSTGPLNMDEVSPQKFDSNYFRNIIQRRGLLISDQSLLDDARTKATVLRNSNGRVFDAEFGRAMQAMGNIGVLTGNAGQIRKNCRFVN